MSKFLHEDLRHLTLIAQLLAAPSVLAQDAGGSAVVEHTFLNQGRYSHRIGVSVFDKQFDNDVNFLGQQIGADVRSRPVSLRYDGEWLRDTSCFGFHVAWLRNLTSGSNNSAEAYTAARAGAEPNWDAWQADAFMDLRVGAGWLRVNLDWGYVLDGVGRVESGARADDDYAFSETAAPSEALVSMSLKRGGFRTITGGIAERNPARYRQRPGDHHRRPGR
ncbi:MAG: hypothetical protein EA417_16755 [Gammaproteobacteria bacterium]|nr:MAG: hypothetical protein EA417_16755 [Gammaproteobacteria bacterium]